MKLSGNVVLVTGGATGIGFAMAEAFLMAGSELNPEGRAGRGGFKAGLTPEEFTATVMKGLDGDVLEIGYGMTAGLLKASRAELDAAFQRMNSRW